MATFGFLASATKTIRFGTGIALIIRPPRGIKGGPENNPRENLLYSHLPVKDKAAGPFNRVEVAYWVYPKKKQESETKTQYEKKIKGKYLIP